MFKIDNEKELVSFLRILTEEAVKKTKKSVLEDAREDALAQSFKSRLKSEKENLYEEEGEEENEMQTGDKEDQSLKPAEEEPPEENDPESQTDDQPESEPSQPEELKASLDALERFINALRAGKSLRDSTVEDQLETYFDRLGDDEKSLLVLFMREVSRILSGKIDGDSAVNPNDEPYNLDVVVDTEETASEPSLSSQESEDAEQPTQALQGEEPEEEEEEEEDTSAPIKVGQPQDLQEIRKRIARLMRS